MSRNRPGSSLHRALAGLPRLGWAVLLAVHLPVLAAAAGRLAEAPANPSGAGAVGALLAAVVFFALKIADVRFLRLDSRRAACVAWLAIAGIVHHEAVSSALREPALPVAVASATIGAVVATRGRRLVPRLHRALRGAFAAPAAPLPKALFDARHDRYAAGRRRASLRRAPARAPPSILRPA